MKAGRKLKSDPGYESTTLLELPYNAEAHHSLTVLSAEQ